MTKIAEYRKKIDGIDRSIVRLLEERAELAGRIGAEKKAAGVPVEDAAREEEIIERVLSSTKLKAEFARDIFQRIIDYCKDGQR